MEIELSNGKWYEIAKEKDPARPCFGCAFEFSPMFCVEAMEKVDCGATDVIFIDQENEYSTEVPLEVEEEPMESSTTKETNPKDAVGVTKAPLSVLPMQVVYEAALGMYEGALKYGAFNYRLAGVRASVYYDAVERHLNQWWEGEDIDPDSGLNHITKAITTLMVMRDAMLNDKFTDDRPPKILNQDWMRNYNDKVKQLQAKYPNPIPRYTWKDAK